MSEKAAELVKMGKRLEISQNIQDADRFVDRFIEITTYVPPKDLAVAKPPQKEEAAESSTEIGLH